MLAFHCTKSMIRDQPPIQAGEMSTRLDGRAIDLVLGSLGTGTRKAKINRTHSGDTTNALFQGYIRLAHNLGQDGQPGRSAPCRPLRAR